MHLNKGRFQQVPICYAPSSDLRVPVGVIIVQCVCLSSRVHTDYHILATRNTCVLSSSKVSCNGDECGHATPTTSV